MAIKGEVVKSMVWSPKISLNDGRYIIRPFECWIVGKAEGLARVRASIHTLFAIFDDEEWRIITLFVNHLDSKFKYTDLFAASCGSIGDFTDIKQGDDAYAMTRQMKHYNFPVQNPDGTFYAQVHPFDPSYFAVKVHPTGALLFTPHHSQLTLLQHIIIQSPFLKQPVQFLSDIPKYWLEDDGTMLNPIVGNQRKQLHGCVREASIRSPTPSKQILARKRSCSCSASAPSVHSPIYWRSVPNARRYRQKCPGLWNKTMLVEDTSWPTKHTRCATTGWAVWQTT